MSSVHHPRKDQKNLTTTCIMSLYHSINVYQSEVYSIGNTELTTVFILEIIQIRLVLFPSIDGRGQKKGRFCIMTQMPDMLRVCEFNVLHMNGTR